MSAGPAPTAPDRLDFRAGLVFFGAVDLLLAIGYLIKALALALIAITGANPRPNAFLFAGELPVAALLAFIPAAFFLAIGIGSILGRRWARSISLALASLALALGAVTAGFLYVLLPVFFRAAGRKNVFDAYASIALVCLVLPAVYVLFFRSKRVKATCEALDSEKHWTDGCPGVVLASMIILVASAMLALGLAFSSSRQALLFGRPLGGSFRAVLSGAALAEIFVAWNLGRRKRWAWVAAVALMAARCVFDFAIVRRLTVDRFEQVLSSFGRMTARDRANLDVLRTLHPSVAVTAYVLAISLLAIGIVAASRKWFRDGVG